MRVGYLVRAACVCAGGGGVVGVGEIRLGRAGFWARGEVVTLPDAWGSGGWDYLLGYIRYLSVIIARYVIGL